MIIVDEERIFKEIEEKHPGSVSLNGPDGILPQIQQKTLQERLHVCLCIAPRLFSLVQGFFVFLSEKLFLEIEKVFLRK